VDGALCQVAGTVPLVGPPGKANVGIAPRVVATSVELAGAGVLDTGALVTGALVTGAPVTGAPVGAGMAAAGGLAVVGRLPTARRPWLHAGNRMMAAAAISAGTAFTSPWTGG
jgi:hypothetical protein